MPAREPPLEPTARHHYRTGTDKANMPVFLNQDDALALWRDALSASVRGDGPDLSARQIR
ncbi:MAG: hypothetical protein ACKVH1_05620 [Alphaproteobacteria bacterium]